MITYYRRPHEVPYIEEPVNFLVDYHLVYATVIVYLIGIVPATFSVSTAWSKRCHMADGYPMLKPLVG